MLILGNNVALYVQQGDEYTEVGFSTNCDLEVTADIIDRSSFMNAWAKNVRIGRYGWTMSCASLVASEDAVRHALLNNIMEGRRILLTMNIEVEGVTDRVYGYAYVQSFRQSSPMNAIASYNVSLVGDGPLTPINNKVNEN
jgi:light-regulated signal transduction histidine kinase (bacteriophytochrome)